jgi:capsid protein
VGPSGRRRILHHFRQLRPEQPRGVPYLAPIIDHLKQLGRYTEAEIQAAVMSAMFTVFIETETGALAGAGLRRHRRADRQRPRDRDGPGRRRRPGQGREGHFAEPMRPNTAFDPFVKSIDLQIGVGLGLPFELLIKQFNASYSASKAALLDAWMWFRSQRTWLARSFCQPVYETWLAEAVATGASPRRASSRTRSCAGPTAARAGMATARARSTRRTRSPRTPPPSTRAS